MSEKFTNLLTDHACLDLYRENGCRRLGLRVPVDPRGLSRRFEEIRVALELGQGIGGWAFAPGEQTPIEELRTAMRNLQEPMRRLLDEFFWFWPMSYPNIGDDVAMDAFMSGDTATATTIWSEAAGRGDAVGWHNLAVYQHLLALEWLDSNDTVVLAGLWRDAVDYWHRVIADTGVWSRVTTRIGAMNDPQLPVSTAGLLRAGLPDLLARIHAGAAMHKAGQGDDVGCRLQIGHITSWMTPAESDALVMRSAQPVVRRIASQIAEARRSGGGSLIDIKALLDSLKNDMAILQAIGKPVASLLFEQQWTLGEVILDQLAVCRQGDQAQPPVLALLMVVLDLVGSGPLSQRTEAMFTQALNDALASGPDSVGVDSRTCALIQKTVLPGLESLPLTDTSRAATLARVAAWLHSLADSAVQSSPAMLGWGLQTMEAAFALPLDQVSMDAMRMTLRRWSVMPRMIKRPALELSADGRTLRIDVVGVTLDGTRVESAELTGIRYTLPELGGAGPAMLYWSNASRVWELPQVFSGDPAAFLEVLTAFHQLTLPNFINRVVEAVRGGAKVPVGGLQLTATGIFTSNSSVLRSYASLRLASLEGMVSLTDNTDVDFALRLDPAVEWNVCLLPLFILLLTPR